MAELMHFVEWLRISFPQTPRHCGEVKTLHL